MDNIGNILEDKKIRPDSGPEDGGGGAGGGVPVDQTSPQNMFPQEVNPFEYDFEHNHFGDVMAPSTSSTKQDMTTTLQQNSTQQQQQQQQQQPLQLQAGNRDVFYCGNCRQNFFHIEYFFDHKEQCDLFTNSTITGLLGDEPELTNKVEASGTNYVPTSHQQQQQQRQQQQHQDSGLSSLLSNTVVDNDLLSLSSSFDPSSMLSLGNSISPTLLHLQSGDIGATPEDFVGFHQLGGGSASQQQVVVGGTAAAEGPSAVIEQSARQQQVQQQQHQTLQVHPGSHGHVHHSASSLYTNEPSSGSLNVDALYDMIIDSSNESTNLLKTSFDPTLSSVGVLDQDSRSSNLLVSPVSDYYTNTLVSATPDAGPSTSSDHLNVSNLAAPGSVEKVPTVMVEHRPQSTASSSSSTNYEMIAIAPDMVFQLMDQPTENNNNNNNLTANEMAAAATSAAVPNTTASSSSSSTSDAVSSIFFPKVKLEVMADEDVSLDNKKTLDTVKEDIKPPPEAKDSAAKMKVNQCVECDRTFSKHSDWLNHKCYHTGLRPYLCTVCGRAFSCRPNFNKHIRVHNLPPDEEAEAVKQTLAFRDLKIKERTTLNKKVGYEVELAAAAAESNLPVDNSSLQQPPQPKEEPGHSSNQQQQPNVLTCAHKDCGLLMPDVNAYMRHIKLHEQQKKLAENVNNNNSTLQQASSSSNLPEIGSSEESKAQQPKPVDETAQQSPPKPQQQQQDTSSKTASESAVTSAAAEVQTAAKTEQQQQPSVETNGMSSIKKKSGKKRQPKFFRCDTCLSRYSSEEALHKHQKTTSHRYPCAHCSKIFPCERYLRRHLMTHGADAYPCRYCDKAFKTANYLKVHIVIHTGEKPFACTTCASRFNRRDKLKRHLLTHDPVKKYKCNVADCTRAFNRPDKFKAHLKTHSGVKPYSCNLCNRCFTRPAHLREHHKTHANVTVRNKELRPGVAAAAAASTNQPIAIASKPNTTVAYVPIKAEDQYLLKQSGDLVTLAANKNENYSILSMITGTDQTMMFYTCPMCGDYFTHENELRKHLPCSRKRKAGDTNSNNKKVAMLAVSNNNMTSTPRTIYIATTSNINNNNTNLSAATADQEMMPPPPPPPIVSLTSVKVEEKD